MQSAALLFMERGERMRKIPRWQNYVDIERFKQAIIDHMRHNDMSQHELARRLGVKQNHISRILSGDRGIGFDYFVTICEKLGWSYDRFRKSIPQ